MPRQRLLALVHEQNAGPGVFAEAAHERGWDLSEWFVPAGDDPPADPLGYDAVIIFGGARNADEEAKLSWLDPEKDLLRKLLDTGIPTLGVCLGSQLLAEAAGAPVERAPAPEIGWFRVEVTAEGATDPLLEGLDPDFEAFQWHSYRSPLPPGAVELASSETGLQAYRIGASAWGIQFHAEVAEVDAVSWAVNYAVDPDAVRIGIDADTLSAEILERIGAWNQLGRDLCGRFLEAAA